jgi:hypothetical protein
MGALGGAVLEVRQRPGSVAPSSTLFLDWGAFPHFSMASTASCSELSSASISSHEDIGEESIGQTVMEHRPQAGPLPVKTPRLAGEIGYSEDAARSQNVEVGDGQDGDDSIEGLDAAEVDARNGRHPADRSHVNLASLSNPSLLNANPSTGQTPPNINSSTTSLNTTSKHSIFSIRSLTSRLSSRTWAGITLKTLIRLFSLVFILCGFIVAWVFAAQLLSKTAAPTANPTQTTGTSAIFVHVAFTIASLLILIFIERAVFQCRAERYAHLHPGQMLPSHYHRAGGQTPGGRSNGMAFAPWNRPSLPTYAAALGVRGTGDVEDAIIAAPPPPAYGNTRGSTLILASFFRNSRASNRSRTSAGRADASPQTDGSPSVGRRASDASTRSLPISYAEVEHQSDVERARILEEALAKLEDNTGRRE